MPCVYKHDFFVSYPHMPDGNIVMKFVDELVRAIEFLRTGPRLPEPVYRDATRLLPGFRWETELARALSQPSDAGGLHGRVFHARVLPGGMERDGRARNATARQIRDKHDYPNLVSRSKRWTG